ERSVDSAGWPAIYNLGLHIYLTDRTLQTWAIYGSCCVTIDSTTVGLYAWFLDM
ncbi:hypothetical protein HN51_047814, partial [Arachis hypogaea]